MEGDLDAAPPRRKTVGFVKTHHDRLDDGRAADGVSGFIAVEDVESKQSHSIFERASEDLNAKDKSQDNDDKDPGGPNQSEMAKEQSCAAEMTASAFHPKPE